MTPLNLDQLLRVADEATPGPWERIGSSVTNWHDHTFEMEWMPNGCGGECDPNANWEADATFIATFDPPTVKALIEQNRALVEAVRGLLAREAERSPSGQPNGCACINFSREAEREYEAGECPHQKAQALLTTIEANHDG